MARKKAASSKLSIPDQLEEVSRMTNHELEYVIGEDESRPGIIKQFASAIIDGEIGDTLKIIKEVSKMRAPDEEKKSVSIEDLAVGDDDEALYVALLKNTASQLERNNISPQETARLSQNLNIFRKELREIRSRKPKAGSTLERVLAAAAAGQNKPETKSKIPTKKNSTSVKMKTTSRKAAGAAKTKKTDVVPSKGRK